MSDWGDMVRLVQHIYSLESNLVTYWDRRGGADVGGLRIYKNLCKARKELDERLGYGATDEIVYVKLDALTSDTE